MVTQNRLCPKRADLMSLIEARPIVLVSTRESRENEKSTRLKHFSTSKNGLNEVFTFKIGVSFFFEIPWDSTAALYEFSIY